MDILVPGLLVALALLLVVVLFLLLGRRAGDRSEAEAMRQQLALAMSQQAETVQRVERSLREQEQALAKVVAERLDRTEKAQAEPVGKLARIQESIDRLEQRQQQHAAAPAAAPEVTGSVTPKEPKEAKEESRPQIAEGWRLRDFYDGRAVVESRNGTQFKVGPGSNVPGLGRVEAIRRENGKVVVVTASGIIAASLEPRRPTYYYRW